MKYLFQGKSFYADELERYYAWLHEARYAEILTTSKRSKLGFIVTTKTGRRVAYYHKRISYRTLAGVRCWLIDPDPCECLMPSLHDRHVKDYEAWQWEQEHYDAQGNWTGAVPYENGFTS